MVLRRVQGSTSSPEVESPFILRAKQAVENQMPMFALFEVDNAAWQIDCVENIRAWLALKLEKADPTIPILA